MRDRRNGESKPMTMQHLRKRIEQGEVFHYDTGWECLCFIETKDIEWL